MSTSNQTGIEDIITLSSIGPYNTSDTITLSDYDTTITNGGYTLTGGQWPGNLSAATLTTATLNPGAITGTTFAYPNTIWSSNLSNSTSGTIELNGDNADIKVNGTSLMSMLREIKERLNLLEPNTELEADWDDLRALGEQYRELEKKCKEKAEAWNKLKSMPPPSIP